MNFLFSTGKSARIQKIEVFFFFFRSPPNRYGPQALPFLRIVARYPPTNKHERAFTIPLLQASRDMKSIVVVASRQSCCGFLQAAQFSRMLKALWLVLALHLSTTLPTAHQENVKI